VPVEFDMKRIVGAALGIAAAGFLGLAAPASASDLPQRAPAEMMPVKAPGRLPFNWGGMYAGLNLGGGFGDVSGFIIGGQIGYNWQVNQLVFGIETDLQWSSQEGSATLAGVSSLQDLDWFGTFRGRIGYAAWDRWLPYFTAGLAYGGRTVKFGPFKADDTSVGWAIGVGVDYAINQAWSARLEYLHLSLDSFSPTFGAVAVNAGRLDNDIIRGAVNYKIMP
jgi:outer membrane immunogenic protein